MSIDVVTYLRNLASPDPYDERPTPHAKELYQAADEIETLKKQLRTEKDSHLSTGHTIGAKAQILFLELAASQAREQQLREVLEDISALPFPTSNPKMDSYEVMQRERACTALNLPQDDTALREWGAKLLREMADEILRMVDYDPAAGFLQGKADELEGK